MMIMGMVVFSALILFAIMLITILFGAASRETAKDMAMRAEWERQEALERNPPLVPDPIRERPVEV
ncbi:hypothetical protein [Stigmatella aurantiaca]|uniref:Uncharacterized protein n=1 Tax=Stigmatella aurantiaca (strain DW4/3-1) TaxID=378806 RepID=Q09DW0_STIAD|nr:hypothetical protein [Stigmatella aurantiaca]ADO75204.1 uncharacterized protein STAUR_7448 [Stigmatella aurantiaca DW4/3-1]EAU69868.1 hypothetical protein STIAU_5565 [Stigmatella aurantiaca DW4/3-1]